MRMFLVALGLIGCVLAQPPVTSNRITDVEGYPIEWLREPQPGTNGAPLDQAVPEPLRPLSMRIIYRRLNYQFQGDNILVVRGNQFFEGGVVAKLVPAGSTTCNVAPWVPPSQATAPALLASPLNLNGGATKRYFTLPVADEIPHENLMPWLCVCSSTANAVPGAQLADCPIGPAANPGNWIFTNLRYAVAPQCDGDNSLSRSATNVDVNHLCDTIASTITPQLAFGEVDPITGQRSWRNERFLERRSRTKCCGWRETGERDLQNRVLNKRFGICINPLLESCCSRNENNQGGFQAKGGAGKPYSRFREKCCYGGNYTFEAQLTSNVLEPPEPTVTSYLDDWCPCTRSKTQAMCNQVKPGPPIPVPNSPASAATCCIKDKYPELLKHPDLTNGDYTDRVWGKCFDGITQKCCNTGDLYDPGSQQCCAINGVQTINVPCPCSTDAHCIAQNTNSVCCSDGNRQILPRPMENAALCNPYTNFPHGSGPIEAQPCLGQCIDTRFQICCNGKLCMNDFEMCCNSTCCNKFNQRCVMGIRAGAQGQFANRNDWRVPFEVCTAVEALTPFRATQVYFLPLFLLIATFLSLAAVLFFAKRQSTLMPMSAYEKSMFALSAIAVLVAWPLYFSPLYKYGIVSVWAAFFVMLASLSQLRALNLGAIIVLGILLIYLIDPFYGNEILTLAEDRRPPVFNGVHGYSGVLSSIAMHAINEQQACTSWYEFFRRDVRVEDQLRWDNPHKFTFGFCARDWFSFLSVFSGLLIIDVFVLFFVALITHIRNVLFEKAQKTDDLVGWY